MMRFTLPDLGEGLREAEIVAWHAGVGDRVVADQPLVSVETDKAVVEVPSPRAGRIAARFGEPGDVVEVGAPLVEFEADVHEDAGTVVGSLAPCAPEPAPAPEREPRRGGRARAAPAVRRRAADLGVDLGELTGTGPDGSVTLEDVRRAAGAAAGLDADGWEPLRGPRRAMAEAMARSRDEIAPTTVTDEAPIERWRHDENPTVRLVRALARGCEAVPALNAWLDAGRGARRLHERLHLGLAMDTAAGLFVPVLRDAGALDPAALRAEIARLRAAVEARTVSRADLAGATMTLSNFGTLGGRHAALAVVPPQVAILGAGRIRDAVLAREGQPVVVRVLPLSLTFDHRAATGGEATRFLAAVVADLRREGP